MTSFETLYQQSLLADASYIDFDEFYVSGTNIVDKEDPGLETELKKRGFTEKQVEDFLGRYTIRNFEPNTFGGFSATIFIDTQNNNKLTVAFRGTEPDNGYEEAAVDFFQDFLLAFGLSYLNPIAQEDYTSTFLFDAGLILADGTTNPNFAQGVDFVGHSLGGFLAVLAAFEFPGLVDQVYTLNGAGISLSDAFLTAVVKPLFSSTDLDYSRVHNYFAEPGAEVTAGQILSDVSVAWRPGSREGMFVENQTGTGNHSMGNLVNILSVSRIFSLLDSSASFADIDRVFWQAVNKEVEKRNADGLPVASVEGAETLDLVMTAFAEILGGAHAGFTTVNDAPEFHEALESAGLTFRVKFSADIVNYFSGTVNNETDTKESRAYMYALVEGVPFALIPDNGAYSDGIFSSSASSLTYDITQYSQNYFRDRLSYFEAVMENNQDDLFLAPKIDGEVVYFWDDQQGGLLAGESIGQGGNSTTSREDGKNILFGGTANEEFVGRDF
ncbi:MAG: pimeloyl-ACP methyl ester carboxylesterase, partial [Lentisphaeria bacterium]